jgi:phosphoribosyl isomerase A
MGSFEVKLSGRPRKFMGVPTPSPDTAKTAVGRDHVQAASRAVRPKCRSELLKATTETRHGRRGSAVVETDRSQATGETFALLPAVDVADGQAVRLVQGKAASETSHGAPLNAALAWQADGAEWIHLVDLDAAFERGSNAELLAAVIGELDVDVQLSGGIHDDASLAQALSTGCTRVILSTVALKAPSWCTRVIAAHGERIAMGLDVSAVEDRDGSIHYRNAARGGTHDGGDLWETLALFDRVGCARYVVTDVSRDGMLPGANVELYLDVTRATSARVIASGGISTIADLVVLDEATVAGANLDGSIVGKALYARRFTLPEALKAMHQVDVARSRVDP